MKRFLSILAAVLLVVLISLFSPAEEKSVTVEIPPAPVHTETAPSPATENTLPEAALPDPHGSYTTKEDVALYIHTYGCLPENFITKSEARKLGWEGGGLDDYAWANASAVTASATTRSCCRRTGSISNATSTPSTKPSGVLSGSFFPRIAS